MAGGAAGPLMNGLGVVGASEFEGVVLAHGVRQAACRRGLFLLSEGASNRQEDNQFHQG
jgi:hypothetical protein